MAKIMCLGYKFTFRKNNIDDFQKKELYEFSKFTCSVTEPSCVHNEENFEAFFL